MNVNLAYGRNGLTVKLPDSAETTILNPRFVPGLEDETATMLDALRNPIESPPLRDLVSSGDQIAVVFSDITRPQPRERMLPVLLDELSGTVPDEQILLIRTHQADLEDLVVDDEVDLAALRDSMVSRCCEVQLL